MPKRLCGASRVAGGIYLTTKSGAGGKSIADFLIDPPIPLTWQEQEKLNLSPLGVNPREVEHTDGTKSYTIFDWIGADHYPFWPDFYEEVRRYGLSRRMAVIKSILGAFQKNGTYILVHPHGHIIDPEAHINDHILRSNACPTRRHDQSVWLHMAETDNRHCQGLLWEAVDDDKDEEDPMVSPITVGNRLVHRAGADFKYKAWKSPRGVRPEFAPAIVMSIPLEYCRFEFVESPEPLVNNTIRELAKISDLDAVLVKE